MIGHGEPVCQKLTSDWLSSRHDGIGSSDAPVIMMGEHYGRSIHDLWREKVGLDFDDPPREETLAMRLGNLLEGGIRAIVGGAEDWPMMVRHPKHRFALATPDAWLPERDALLEIKTSAMSEWDEGIPEGVRWQVQHQLWVTGFPRAVVAVARFRGSRIADLQQFDLEANPEEIAALEAKEAAFWACVSEESMPAVDGSDGCRRTLAKLYANPAGGTTVALDGRFIEIDSELAELKATRKGADVRIALLENEIKAAIGTFETGILPDGTAYSWKVQKRGEHVVKASEFRVLRRKGARDDG